MGDASQQPRSCMLSDGLMWDVSLRGALAGRHLMHALAGTWCMHWQLMLVRAAGLHVCPGVPALLARLPACSSFRLPPASPLPASRLPASCLPACLQRVSPLWTTASTASCMARR